MADDSSRNSLFGSAASRNTGRSNPYAETSSSSSSTPSAAASLKADPAFGDGSPTQASPPITRSPSGTETDDPARASLLSGASGRRSHAPGPSNAAAVAAAVHPAVEAPMDDGALEFDFEGLNMMESTGEEGGELGDDSNDNLNFAAIDEDLQKFASDEVIREALSRGVDLRVYSRQVDAELRHMEMLSIEDYVKEADAIAELFEQIVSCESILNDMQTMLGSFQENLGGISEEIRSLQEQSLSLSVKMANRKSLAGKINTFLAKVSVPESLITRIVDGNVDEMWIKDLQALSEKIAFTTGGSLGEPSTGGDYSLSDLSISPLHTPVGRESLPQIDKLRMHASGKLRAFFARSIGELIKPKTNMAKQQEYILLRFAPAMAFLNDHGGEVGREVRSMYADQVGRSYAAIFKKYHEDLARLLLPLPARSDTIADYNPAARLASALSSDPSLSSQPHPIVDPFALGDRMHVLTDADLPAVAAHVAQAERMRFTFESMWRSLVRHLMDIACSEYSFDNKFFGERLGAEMFTLTMAGAVSMLLAALEEHLLVVFDAPGLMLLVALTAAQRRIMITDRKCDVLEPFFDRVTLLLWPRFKMVLDENVRSVRAGKDNIRRFAPIEVQAHPLAKRYAEFVSSILMLHRRLAVIHLSDESLPHHTAALGREMDALFQKMAGELSNRTAKVVFMVNNYSMCLSIAQARALDPEDSGNWDRAADHYMTMYTDSELETYFRSMVAFVKKWEAAALAAAGVAPAASSSSSGSTPAAGAGTTVAPEGTLAPSVLTLPDTVTITVDAGEAEAVLRDFNINWRSGIKSLADNVSRYYGASSAGLATVILKRVLGAFINNYEKFTVLLARGLPPTFPALREVVNVQTIYFELRKYSRTDGS